MLLGEGKGEGSQQVALGSLIPLESIEFQSSSIKAHIRLYSAMSLESQNPGYLKQKKNEYNLHRNASLTLFTFKFTGQDFNLSVLQWCKFSNCRRII